MTITESAFFSPLFPSSELEVKGEEQAPLLIIKGFSQFPHAIKGGRRDKGQPELMGQEEKRAIFFFILPLPAELVFSDEE